MHTHHGGCKAPRRSDPRHRHLRHYHPRRPGGHPPERARVVACTIKRWRRPEGGSEEVEEITGDQSARGGRDDRVGVLGALMFRLMETRLSSVGPAAMGLTGSPLIGSECNPAGFILAASLWW